MEAIKENLVDLLFNSYSFDVHAITIIWIVTILSAFIMCLIWFKGFRKLFMHGFILTILKRYQILDYNKKICELEIQ